MRENTTEEIETMTMQEETYKCILRSLSEAVCAVDLHWRIICFNHQAERLMGVQQKEALGAPLQKVFPAKSGQLRFLIARVIESGKPMFGKKLTLFINNGKTIPVIVKAAPVRNKNGSVHGVAVIFQDNRRIEILRRELRQAYTHGDIVTKDEQMRQILEILPNVAESDSSVLISGPTGTGKELLARAIHLSSPRQKAPFVAVNCGALPDSLLESELFGYKQGAFTDAKRDKPGRFDLAQGGTLLLDEIGDISPAMQVKLLRVLEEKTYEPLGSTESVYADVRVLAATNQDLQTMVDAGTFRADLYYRLNVIEFHIPPLADRPGDIPLLLEHFVELLNAEKGRDIKGVSPAAMICLMRYTYPGNVRELRNIIEHAYVLCPGDEIRPECLPSRILSLSESNTFHQPKQPVMVPLRRMTTEEQHQTIVNTLQKHNGNRAKTAEVLGIDPSTLWRKMKKHEILFPGTYVGNQNPQEDS